MTKHKVPIMGEVEAQICSNCQGTPIVEALINIVEEHVLKTSKYNICYEVSCGCCGLSAPLGVWNSLHQSIDNT